MNRVQFLLYSGFLATLLFVQSAAAQAIKPLYEEGVLHERGVVLETGKVGVDQMSYGVCAGLDNGCSADDALAWVTRQWGRVDAGSSAEVYNDICLLVRLDTGLAYVECSDSGQLGPYDLSTLEIESTPQIVLDEICKMFFRGVRFLGDFPVELIEYCAVDWTAPK